MSLPPTYDEQTPEPNTDVIRIVDPNLRAGFAQLPRPVLKAKGLSDRAKVVYALLLDYAWRDGSCFPGQQRLAEDLHTTERTIRTALSELRDYQLISWQRRGLMKTNVYYILSLAENPNLDLEVQIAPDRKKTSGQDRKKTAGQDRKPASAKEYSVKNTQSSNSSNIRKGKPSGKNAGEWLVQESQPSEALPGLPRTVGIETVGNVIRRRPSRPSASPVDDDDREVVLAYISDFSREFADRAPLKSSTTRALNLYRQSGLERQVFIDALYQARVITKERAAAIHGSGGNSTTGAKNKMAYFFSVLEDVLGLKDDAASPSSPQRT